MAANRALLMPSWGDDDGVSVFSVTVFVFVFAVPVGFCFSHFLRTFYDGKAVRLGRYPCGAVNR